MTTTPAELQTKLFKSLKSDMTLMLGLTGVDEGHSQPMTAQFDGDDRRTIWFFTAKDTDLAQALGGRHEAIAHFSSKGHDLFATIHGDLSADNDPAMIDKLWNKWVAAWFEGGKTDPKLLLLRFDLERAQIWLNENNLLAGVKMLLGSDPKKDYADKTAEVRLN